MLSYITSRIMITTNAWNCAWSTFKVLYKILKHFVYKCLKNLLTAWSTFINACALLKALNVSAWFLPDVYVNTQYRCYAYSLGSKPLMND